MSVIKIHHPTKKINARVRIPGSKSESNRLLILDALSGHQLKLHGLSSARDTQNLIQILASKGETADVLDAGTAMRFLTAYYCASNQYKIITGTDRMKERPIGPLVNALSEIGFDIRYMEKEGFPPLEVNPVKFEKLESETFVEGNISSQFITALLLIAPFLPNGLKVNFTTELTSKPYVEMTMKILQQLGVSYIWGNNFIQISPAKLHKSDYWIGGDWSAASYWYSVAFLADEAEILLEGMKDDWIQGDREISEWMNRFGVTTEFTKDGALLRKVSSEHPKLMKMNFMSNPDLAQTFAVMFAGRNIYGTFSGIESLKIKETNRIAALQQELRRMNVFFDYSDMYEFYQLKGEWQPPGNVIQTYNDHRMAMAFAPLGLLGEIQIDSPEVVEKSYPAFWDELKKAGFAISEVKIPATQ